MQPRADVERVIVEEQAQLGRLGRGLALVGVALQEAAKRPARPASRPRRGGRRGRSARRRAARGRARGPQGRAGPRGGQRTRPIAAEARLSGAWGLVPRRRILDRPPTGPRGGSRAPSAANGTGRLGPTYNLLHRYGMLESATVLWRVRQLGKLLCLQPSPIGQTFHGGHERCMVVSQARVSPSFAPGIWPEGPQPTGGPERDAQQSRRFLDGSLTRFALKAALRWQSSPRYRTASGLCADPLRRHRRHLTDPQSAPFRAPPSRRRTPAPASRSRP